MASLLPSCIQPATLSTNESGDPDVVITRSFLVITRFWCANGYIRCETFCCCWWTLSATVVGRPLHFSREYTAQRVRCDLYRSVWKMHPLPVTFIGLWNDGRSYLVPPTDALLRIRITFATHVPARRGAKHTKKPTAETCRSRLEQLLRRTCARSLKCWINRVFYIISCADI